MEKFITQTIFFYYIPSAEAPNVNQKKRSTEKREEKKSYIYEILNETLFDVVVVVFRPTLLLLMLTLNQFPNHRHHIMMRAPLIQYQIFFD